MRQQTALAESIFLIVFLTFLLGCETCFVDPQFLIYYLNTLLMNVLIRVDKRTTVNSLQ